MIKQRAGTAEMRSENEARIAGQDDQHERSMSRRAEARAAHDADA
jgi:hypothetical protein